MGIVGILAGNLFDLESLDVHQPDRSGLAAAIALPRVLPLLERDIGQSVAVVGEAACGDARQRHELRGSDPVGAYPVQPREVRVARMIGGEQYVLAVGGPADDAAAGGFPGQTPRYAALRTHHVHIHESACPGRVGDLLVIRGIIRSRPHGTDRGESARFSAIPRDGPNIVRVQERDPILAERGIAEQQGRGTPCGCTENKAGDYAQSGADESVAKHAYLGWDGMRWGVIDQTIQAGICRTRAGSILWTEEMRNVLVQEFAVGRRRSGAGGMPPQRGYG